MKHIKLYENFLNENKVYKKPTSKVISDIYDSIDDREGGYNKKFPDVDPKVIKIILDCWENRRENRMKSEIDKYYQIKK